MAIDAVNINTYATLVVAPRRRRGQRPKPPKPITRPTLADVAPGPKPQSNKREVAAFFGVPYRASRDRTAERN